MKGKLLNLCERNLAFYVAIILFNVAFNMMNPIFSNLDYSAKASFENIIHSIIAFIFQSSLISYTIYLRPTNCYQ